VVEQAFRVEPVVLGLEFPGGEDPSLVGAEHPDQLPLGGQDLEGCRWLQPVLPEPRVDRGVSDVLQEPADAP